LNTLNPGVKKGNWEAEEDFLIFKLFTEFGSQWSKINLHFERRTENSIKNRFYSTLRRIAAEKRKETTSNTDSTCEMSNGNSKTKLDSLLKYVPDAIKEKTLKLMKKNGNHELVTNINMNNIIDFTGNQQNFDKEHEHITYSNNNDNNNVLEDDKVLPFKQLEDDETMNEANILQNINNNNNSDGDDGTLFPDDNICYLDCEINNFLDNFFEKNEKNCNLTFLHEAKENDDTDSNLNVNSDNIHGSNLNSMVQQLSSLEELLQNTKKQILSGSAFSEPQKVLSK